MDYKTKRTIIEGLLDHWEDFTLPSVGGNVWGTGEGIGIVFTSGMGSYPSVVELDRCLGVLRVKVPNHFKHLRGHYSSEWRTADMVAKIASPSNPRKMIETTVRRRVRVVPGWVTWRIVDHALDMLVALWDPGVVLELPPALNRKLREFTDGEGTHLTEAA